MKKWVVKAGERARVVSVGHHEADGSEDHMNASPSAEHGAVVLETLLAELVAAQGSASAVSRSALKAAQTEVEGIARESLGQSELFAALLGIGRRYYDACWESLSQAEQGERRGQISASLGDAADSMDLEAYETTLDELCRRALRGRDPLFDPQCYWSL
jgi:hypothetical protein